MIRVVWEAAGCGQCEPSLATFLDEPAAIAFVRAANASKGYPCYQVARWVFAEHTRRPGCHPGGPDLRPLTPGQVYSLRAERDGWDLPHSGQTMAFDGQDWKIDRVTFVPRAAYPFRVEGRNLNSAPEDADYRFSWSVPRLDDWRFDLSEAIIIRGSL